MAGTTVAARSLAFLGLGAIGQATLRLALQALPEPARLALCDVYAHRDGIAALAREVRAAGWTCPVDVHVSPHPGTVPDALYEADLIIGATNAGSVLDVERLAPGTLIVDDASPHCFDTAGALARIERDADILVAEGGALRLGIDPDLVLSLPSGLDGLGAAFAERHAGIVMACTLSALLAVRETALPPTIGPGRNRRKPPPPPALRRGRHDRAAAAMRRPATLGRPRRALPRALRQRRPSHTAMIVRYTRFVIRHRWAVIVLMALVTVLLAVQTGSLTTDVREDSALPKNHPFVQLDREIHRLFRGHKMLVIGLTVREGSIYTPATLAKIVRITNAVERLPGLVSEALFSLASTRVKNIRATADGIDVEPFLVTVPQDDRGLARLRADVEAHPPYVDYLVSADGRSAAIFADFRNEANDVDLQARVEAIVAPERDAGTAIRLGGVPIVLAQVNRYTARMAILFPCAVLLIALVHYHAFRTVQAMILPLVTALVSVIWALGIIASLGFPLDTWSSITPVLILAIAAGHAVQILKRYYEEFARLGDSHEAIVAALAKVGPVMIIAGSIAAAGFASLTTFDVPSVRVFGLLLTAGIVSALLIELTLIPAFRAVLPAPREREAAAEARADMLDAPLRRLAARTAESPRSIVAVTVAITAVLSLGIGACTSTTA